ncbi:MAG: hypothetical protein ABII06_09605 [Pseudomonadota bacterium]
MKNSSMVKEFEKNDFDSGNPSSRFYSVEFAVEGLHYLYQFKIWSMAESSMSFLVKEGSRLLRNLKVGDTISMKYYSSNSINPTECLPTEIRNITKEEKGKFKGHYLVNLAIRNNYGLIKPPEIAQKFPVSRAAQPAG